ncbi:MULTISPECIES: DUF5990 family protein [unclassified Streptomyces]|uniref:DUF5990 family protein n=1 Tax=unclassified Streptomyces TaxID=2593676 RepID=UPI00342C5EBC
MAPGADALEPVAAAAGRTVGDVLAEPDREDFLTLDEDGQVRAAYPFCAVPTPHRVRIDGGAQVWSMCAVEPYLTWGSVDEAGTFAMFRRAKLMLDAVDPDTTAAALRSGRLLARLRLTDACGRPLCAQVRPPLVEWSAPAQWPDPVARPVS